MSIQSPQGNTIGSIKQKWGLRPELHVKDESNQVQFIVKGPFCQFSCRCGDVEFPVRKLVYIDRTLKFYNSNVNTFKFNITSQIYSSDGISECGKISKRWRGVLHEAFTDADIFGVKFPPSINPNMKALLLGATFLIVRKILTLLLKLCLLKT